MKPLLAIVFLSVAAAAPLWAQAPPPPSDGPLACLFEGMNAEQRALASTEIERLIAHAPPHDGDHPDLAIFDSVLPLARCAQAGHWSEAQRERAFEWALVRLQREDMQRRYAAQNVDLTYIDAALAATPEGSRPPFEALVARMRAQGVGDHRSDSAGDIVYIYMMLWGQAREIRAEFAGPDPQPR
jgi:hypothetical protein